MRVFVTLCCLVIGAGFSWAADIEPEDLTSGLLAQFTDGKTTLTRIDPIIGFTLAAGEAPHPKLNGQNGTYSWSGYVKILQAGSYQFAATLRGKVVVKIEGKEVFAAESLAAEPVKKQGPAANLASGFQKIDVVFTRPEGLARLELFWKGKNLPEETLPYQILGHLPKDRPQQLTEHLTQEHGRFLFEEHSCAKCHKPDVANPMSQRLVERAGPNLSKVGARVNPAWLKAWLENPKKLRPATKMPSLFDASDAGREEIAAVTAYLSTLGGTFKPQPIAKKDNASINRGKNLFLTVGCATCHRDAPKETPKSEAISFVGLLDVEGAKSAYPLNHLGSKMSAKSLSEFLQNPLAWNPSGRMPHMNLSPAEADDLSRYLTESTTKEIPQQELKPTPEQIALGKKLFQSKGCVNCHETGDKSLMALSTKSLEEIRKSPEQGCVEGKKGGPNYSWGPLEKTALTQFLKEGLNGAGSLSQVHATRLALKRFNCLNCHQRDGEGGISTELADEMKKLEKAENADDIRPPLLTGVGHKLRTSWLKQVLVNSGKARPWMSLRMPQFGESNVGFLDLALARCEGTDSDDTIRKVEITPEKVEAGRKIIGKGGLGCISCHDIAGIPNTGTRGPDLMSTQQRVRYEWYRAWMEVPQRMAPGTRMPQVFTDGKSTLASVLDADPEKQAEAMWAYMSLGTAAKLPDGLEPPKGLIVKVTDRPEILRTFLPEAGNRAIAVGYPGGVNMAFDANTCRLTMAWSGSFLDVSPVWNNRGGQPAKLLGPKFWTSPAGNPWAISGSSTPPDLSNRGKDPAFGVPLGQLEYFSGRKRVHFDGYSLDEKGLPTFEYRVEGETSSVLNVVEKPEPLSGGFYGIARKISLKEASGEGTWFLTTEGNEPKVYNLAGEDQKIDWKTTNKIKPEDRLILVPLEAEKTLVMQAKNLPDSAEWVVTPKKTGGWSIFLHFPAGKELKADFTLNLWSIGRPDPAIVRSLVGGSSGSK